MNQIHPRNITPQDLNNWLIKDSIRPILVDVREKDEIAIASFPFSVIHLPLSEFSNWCESYSEKLPLDKPVVVICHSGVRSFNFCTWLLDQNSRYEVLNLEGGIDAWSLLVDPSVPRY